MSLKMAFKPHELAYLQEVQLGRLATIQPNGTPQVSPVGFTYNKDLGTIDISGYRMSASQKYRNIASNDKVAFVVDDIASRDPWRVRCLEIRGHGRAGDVRATDRRRSRRSARPGDHPDPAAPGDQFRHRRPDHRAAPAGRGYPQRLSIPNVQTEGAAGNRHVVAPVQVAHAVSRESRTA